MDQPVQTLSYHDEVGMGVADDIKHLFAEHYDELCVTKDFPLDPDYEAYQRMADSGCLRVITCRLNERAIGYVVFIIQPHLHYKTCLTAFEDVYFVHKDYRRGRVGIRLFQYAEKALKAAGVNRIIYHTKMHMDNSRLFEYLGYLHSDQLFTKLI